MADPASSPPLVVDLGAGCMVPTRDRSWIAVPLRATAVVAPRPGQAEEANLLQLAVLGLLRTGVDETDVLGKLLGVRAELVEIVMGDLRANAWIDELDAPTPAGELALREPGGSLDYVQLWTFQEPWRGRLLPRFVEHLEPAQVIDEETGAFTVLTGPVGNPSTIRARRVSPGKAGFPPVGHAELTGAYAEFQDHRQRRASHAGADSEPSLKEPHVVAVGGREREVFALTYCFTSDRLPRAREWDVADPTGLWWLGALSDRIRLDAAADLAAVEADLRPKGRPRDDRDREQRRRELGKRVERRTVRPPDAEAIADAWAEVNETLGATTQAHRRLAEALRSEARDRTDLGRRLARLLDTAIGCVRVLAEESLRQARVASGSVTPADLRFSLLRAEREAYAQAAHMIGFRGLPDVFVIRGRRRVGRSHTGATAGLPELVLGSLTQAAADPAHPFRRLAERRPELLSDLELLVPDTTAAQRLEGDLAAADGDAGQDNALRRLAEAGAAALSLLEELAVILAVEEMTREADG